VSRRRMSTKAIAYAKLLRNQVGEAKASEISRRTLAGKDAFEEVQDPIYTFHKKERLYGLSSEQGTLLINALLDAAGRKGRRKNNR
jgi:hypothetical protein